MDDDEQAIEAGDLDHITRTTEIVSAYVANNNVPVTELPALISATHAALVGLASPMAATAPPTEKATPAQIRKSITHDALISFEDGRGYKTLKRHLTGVGLTPERYREKWGLPADYPMTAPGYSEKRSKLALALGLGQVRKGAGAAPGVVETGAAVAEPPRKRGPRKKDA